ncbi:MAG: NUDIX domain-containing protein [Candidatus Aenigmatarchaeota archaeon]
MELIPRAAAIVPKKNSLLLVKHEQGNMSYWIPPGGAVEPEERIHKAVAREVKEETDVDVSVKRPVYYHDFFGGTKHHMEFFFLCEYEGGEVELGEDPEAEDGKEILKDARFVPVDDLEDYTILPHELKLRLIQDAPRGFKEKALYLNEE